VNESETQAEQRTLKITALTHVVAVCRLVGLYEESRFIN
jgi:hypothetical protein